jgi:uncharacterized protein (TIGR02246 family)
MHRLFGAAIFICIAVASFRASAGGQKTGPNDDAEIAAIRAAANNYAAAVRSGDSDVMRWTWAPEGDYIDASGQRFKAHELIPRDTAAPSSTSGPPAAAGSQAPSSTVRLITPTVAIEDGAADIGVADDGSALTGRFTAVWVKRDGRWLLDSLREAITQSVSTNDQLQPLSWLLGEWAGAVDDQEVLISAHWSDGGTYIVREFAMHGGGDRVITGTERIGWEPVFMSWTFDSQGGRSESRWKRDGKRWLVESTKVMPDGQTATATSVFTPENDGAFSWEVSRASIANERLPPLRIEFKRAAEDE